MKSGIFTHKKSLFYISNRFFTSYLNRLITQKLNFNIILSCNEKKRWKQAFVSNVSFIESIVKSINYKRFYILCNATKQKDFFFAWINNKYYVKISYA